MPRHVGTIWAAGLALLLSSTLVQCGRERHLILENKGWICEVLDQKYLGGGGEGNKSPVEWQQLNCSRASSHPDHGPNHHPHPRNLRQHHHHPHKHHHHRKPRHQHHDHRGGGGNPPSHHGSPCVYVVANIVKVDLSSPGVTLIPARALLSPSNTNTTLPPDPTLPGLVAGLGTYYSASTSGSGHRHGGQVESGGGGGHIDDASCDYDGYSHPKAMVVDGPAARFIQLSRGQTVDGHGASTSRSRPICGGKLRGQHYGHHGHGHRLRDEEPHAAIGVRHSSSSLYLVTTTGCTSARRLSGLMLEYLEVDDGMAFSHGNSALLWVEGEGLVVKPWLEVDVDPTSPPSPLINDGVLVQVLGGQGTQGVIAV